MVLYTGPFRNMGFCFSLAATMLNNSTCEWLTNYLNHEHAVEFKVVVQLVPFEQIIITSIQYNQTQ